MRRWLPWPWQPTGWLRETDVKPRRRTAAGPDLSGELPTELVLAKRTRILTGMLVRGRPSRTRYRSRSFKDGTRHLVEDKSWKDTGSATRSK
jgi:hypothetical protein